jgi:hypothetical protein
MFTSVVGLKVLKDSFQQALLEGSGWTPFVHILLLAQSLSLIGLWVWASQKEMDLGFEWLDPKSWEPPTGFRETLLIVSHSGFLVVMFLTVQYPFWYAFVFTLYAVCDLYAIREAGAEGRVAVAACKLRCDQATGDPELAETYRKGINVLEQHYFHRLQIPVRLSRLVLLFAALGCAYGAKGAVGGVLWWASYVLLTAAFTVVEVPLLAWRTARDRALRPLAAQLNEIDRAREAGIVPLEDHH